MLEISPVLAGTFDKPNYMPANVNFNQGAQPAAATASGATDDVADSRRYSQFDRSASKVADADMSFGDFIDMINPLQHIPVVSSLYRYAMGDKINPVSRVAGDILYGAASGLVVGAVAGGIGAIVSSVTESQTGKDLTGSVVAGLFGDDDDKNVKGATQLASNNAAHPAQNPMAAAQPAPQPIVTAEIPTVAAAINAQSPLTAKTYPLGTNKLALAAKGLPDYHSENLKMSVANATGLHIGNTVYPSFVRNGMRAIPATPPAALAPAAPIKLSSNLAPVAPATASLPSATSALSPPDTAASTGTVSQTPWPSTALPSTPPAAAAAETAAATTSAPVVAAAAAQQQAAPAQAASATDTTLPPELKDDALILKALGLYRSVADGTVSVARSQAN